MKNPLEVRFRELLIPKISEQRSLLLTKDQYYELIGQLKEASIRQRNLIGNITFLDTARYRCGDVDKLIRKGKDNSEDPTYFGHINEIFDIIKRAHIQLVMVAVTK